MPDSEDLLIEIGTEELPPQSVRELSLALAQEMAAGLASAGLAHGPVTPYATPRRLALVISELEASQAERQVERRGPALSAAFDEHGDPTKAGLGFAASCGVGVEHLERLETEKGSWLVFRTTEVGQPTASLLPEILERAIARLPIRRRMRWGELEAEFVRPVHWLVLLFGQEVVPAELLGVSAGRQTRGHRFHSPNPIFVDSPAEYASMLYANGHVVADFDGRRDMVRGQVRDAAKKASGSAQMDEDLLEEVTALVEWPSPVVGGFDEEFLALPDAVLTATMKGAQRYFPVLDEDGALLPKFIAISNIESRNPDAVREGNERVLRPRLKDASFFYAVDSQRPLEAYLETMAQVKFQDRLGSMAEKAGRVSRLSGHIAVAMGLDEEAVEHAERAGLLSKCDLATEMVGEFPELQGEMGREYARQSGEPNAVAVALGELYLPRFAGDRIAGSGVGRALAMADKLDTLYGIFGIGEAPTGDKDPFALRRAALGVLRTLIEGELDLRLPRLIDAAGAQYKSLLEDASVAARVFEFMTERLRAYFVEQSIPADVFSAVLARRPVRPYDFARRARAVEAFRQLPEAASLASANKRIQNILKQAEGDLPDKVDDTLFSEDAEWNLAAKLVGLGPMVKQMLGKGDYEQAMRLLAGLRDPVDAFFDTVKVMADDEAVKTNRLALLNNISALFLATADISQLQT